MQNLRKRGRAYKCVNCEFVGERQNTLFHILKQHRKLEEAPFFCTLCGYKAFSWKRLEEHVTFFALHKSKASASKTNSDCLRSSTNARLIREGEDYEVCTPEESTAIWDARPKRKARSTSERKEHSCQNEIDLKLSDIKSQLPNDLLQQVMQACGLNNNFKSISPMSTELEDATELDDPPEITLSLGDEERNAEIISTNSTIASTTESTSAYNQQPSTHSSTSVAVSSNEPILTSSSQLPILSTSTPLSSTIHASDLQSQHSPSRSTSSSSSSSPCSSSSSSPSSIENNTEFVIPNPLSPSNLQSSCDQSDIPSPILSSEIIRQVITTSITALLPILQPRDISSELFSQLSAISQQLTATNQNLVKLAECIQIQQDQILQITNFDKLFQETKQIRTILEEISTRKETHQASTNSHHQASNQVLHEIVNSLGTLQSSMNEQRRSSQRLYNAITSNLFNVLTSTISSTTTNSSTISTDTLSTSSNSTKSLPSSIISSKLSTSNNATNGSTKVLPSSTTPSKLSTSNNTTNKSIKSLSNSSTSSTMSTSTCKSDKVRTISKPDKARTPVLSTKPKTCSAKTPKSTSSILSSYDLQQFQKLNDEIKNQEQEIPKDILTIEDRKRKRQTKDKENKDKKRKKEKTNSSAGPGKEKESVKMDKN